MGEIIDDSIIKGVFTLEAGELAVMKPSSK